MSLIKEVIDYINTKPIGEEFQILEFYNKKQISLLRVS